MVEVPPAGCHANAPPTRITQCAVRYRAAHKPTVFFAEQSHFRKLALGVHFVSRPSAKDRRGSVQAGRLMATQFVERPIEAPLQPRFVPSE